MIKDKVIELACKEIVHCVGVCPFDLYDWQRVDDCANVCADVGEDIWKCWMLYFEKNVQKWRGESYEHFFSGRTIDE